MKIICSESFKKLAKKIDDKKDSKGCYRGYSTDRDADDVFDDSWNAESDGSAEKNKDEEFSETWEKYFPQKQKAGV